MASPKLNLKNITESRTVGRSPKDNTECLAYSFDRNEYVQSKSALKTELISKAEKEGLLSYHSRIKIKANESFIVQYI